MNRFENMDTFARVVETGSISAAADRLGVAKSAVSRRLKELERHLGVELFHRTTRRMNLTDTGETFYRHCVRILEDVVESELAATQAHETLKGKLRVALPSSFGHMHVGPAIVDFMHEHPDIEFDLDFNDREVELMREGYDLAIRLATLPDSSLIARRLAPIRRVMCASPAYLANKGAPVSIDELANHRCLIYSLVPDLEDWQPQRAGRTRLRTIIRPRLRATTGEFLRDAAIAGQGIALLPTFIVYREIERGVLTPLLTNHRFTQINAFALYPQTRHLSRRVRVLVDFLAARFDGTPYWDSNYAENLTAQ